MGDSRKKYEELISEEEFDQLVRKVHALFMVMLEIGEILKKFIDL